MNVKKIAAFGMLGMASLMSTTAFAGTRERESVCLVIGKYAESAADAREHGRPEKEALGLLTPARKGSPEGDLYVALQLVVAWVYTVQLPPQEARMQVYLKCLGREFFEYNPKLDG